MQGFLNLNKSIGMTSHDCVSRLRRLLKMSKIGHGGTLDPAASGVLPVALGKATKLLQFLPKNKAYHATIRFGVTTDTDDLDGKILTSTPAPDLTLAQIETILPNFVGKISQIPPNYSAIQIDGKRLYDLARQGKTIEVPSRIVEVFKIEVVEWRPGNFPELELDIACGEGTYIRAIARDLGQALNIGATLAQLKRTLSANFPLSNSLTLTELEAQLQADTFIPVNPTDALQNLPAIELNADLARRWCQGQKITDTSTSLSASFQPWLDIEFARVYDSNQIFLGIGHVVEKEGIKVLVSKVVMSSNDQSS